MIKEEIMNKLDEENGIFEEDENIKEVSGEETISALGLKKEYKQGSKINKMFKEFLDSYLDSFHCSLNSVYNKKEKTAVKLSYSGTLDLNYYSVSKFEMEFENFISNITE